MGWPVTLALLIAGLLLGQLWARRSRRLWGSGTARPGMALAGLASLLAALVTAVRGLWIEALGLLLLAAVLAGTARTRALGGERGSSSDRDRATRMSIGEAASLLGVPAGAPEAEINAAYRRLMRSVHPDQGGTAGLAAQLNSARDVMLRRAAP